MRVQIYNRNIIKVFKTIKFQVISNRINCLINRQADILILTAVNIKRIGRSLKRKSLLP
jgi:hypothetical protein